jgi:hypothetical protein
MKKLATLVLSMSVAFAAGLPTTQIKGDYVEARTADVYIGACFQNSEAEQSGDLAVFGWRVSEGEYDGVNLDGLSVVGVVRAKTTLGYQYVENNPAKAVLIVDERANPEQRLALKNFAQRMSKGLLADIVRVEYQPISLTFDGNNVHSQTATLKAGNLAAIQTRAFAKGDHFCSHEEAAYAPLSQLDHAMPAFTISHTFKGQGLDATWSAPNKSSSFVGNFQLND